MFILFPLLSISIFNILDYLYVLLLCFSNLLMQIFYSCIQNFIFDCQFGKLLVQKSNICLILCGHDFFLRLDLVQRLMQIFHLIVSDICSFFNSLLQMLDPRIPLLQLVSHLMLHSLVFSLFSVNYFILFFQLSLEFFAFIFEALNYTGISLLNIFDICCMYLGDSFFKIVDLQLVLSFNYIQFFSEHVDFTLKFLPIVFVFLCLLTQTSKQFSNFIVFDRNHFSKAVQLDVKQLILILNASLKILNFKVENFLEFVSQLIQLIAFLFVSFIICYSLLLNKLLHTLDFLIFLSSHFLNSIAYDSFNILFLGQTLLKLTDLELIPLLLFNKLLFEALKLSFLVQISFLLTLKKKGYSFLFGLLCLQLPLLNFPLKFQPLFGPIIAFTAFVIDLQFHVLYLCFFLTQFFFSFVYLVLQIGVLFEDEFILEFKIFCFSESNPDFIEIFLE